MPPQLTGGLSPSDWGVRLLLNPLRSRLLALAVAGICVLLLGLLLPQTVRHWNDRLTSLDWSLADERAQERRVIVIDIDEKSVQSLGPWPWPRERIAQLLRTLDQQGVALKLVDILFDGPQSGDAQLAQALGEGSPTVIGQLFALQPLPHVRSGRVAGALPSDEGTAACARGITPAWGHVSPAASLLPTPAAPGVGHLNPHIDPDGVVRRVPALLCFEGKTYPALTVAALSALTEQPLRWVQAAGLQGPVLQVGDLRLPVSEQGDLWVSYGLPRSAFVSLSAVDLLQGRIPADLLRGSLALIGSTALGAGDVVVTPQGNAVGGIEVHAQLLSAALDGRTPATPVWAPVWGWLGALACAAMLFLLLRVRRVGAGILMPVGTLVGLLGLWCVHFWLLWQHHLMVGWAQPAVFTLLAGALLLATEQLRTRQERERVYRQLSSYLPEGAARKVAYADPSAQAHGQRQDATVMHIDLRNFSAYCEGRSPEDAAQVLHLFYTTIDDIVSQHGGVVEQMVADSILAVWNGSNPCAEHAQKALGAAREIWQRGVEQLPRVSSRRTPALDIGIGIETGPIIIGSFGPARRRVHAVLGETVSTAIGLEGLTGELAYPILLGPEARALNPQLPVKTLGDFLLAGFKYPITVYALPVEYDGQHLHLAWAADLERSIGA